MTNFVRRSLWTLAATYSLSIAALSQTTTSKSSNIVETEADRKPRTKTYGDCFIRNGILLTVTGETINGGDIIVRGGKIITIGKGLSTPAGIPVIEAAGKFVLPGIIDAHSHIAADDVNEGSESIVPEVNIRDVLSAEHISIYRKLASGMTAGLVLHGSADAIGGQSVVIKNKFMHPVGDLLVTTAPRMVKFALGENVKSGFSFFDGGGQRYPAGRIGVETVYRRAFTQAKRYMAEWDAYNSRATTTQKSNLKELPPRRDLRLEALADILRGRIWVQCHCYRSDEMLMMIRLSKEFGFKLAVLQHALEAWKIAKEIAAAGVGVSTFADEWGYKVEAYDAIPHNAAICVRAGILTSVNTDTSATVTPLNLDAAKMMHFGGLTENEALRLITINPAGQLGIANRTGSLEVGKDADITIWDGHPLSSFSKCRMTMVEGEVLFERRDSLGLDQTAVSSTTAPKVGLNTSLTIPNSPFGTLIKGATIHPVSGPVIPEGDLLIQSGRIGGIGINLKVPKGVVVVNAKGLHAYPGLIDTGGLLGLKEIEQVGSTVDSVESGRFQPDLVALTAVNPASAHIPIARAEGVTTAVTRIAPSSFSPLRISGLSSIIRLEGKTTPELGRVERFALNVSFPESASATQLEARLAISSEDWKKRAQQEADDIRKLTDYFETAKRYADSGGGGRADTKLIAMIPFVTGNASVVIHANSTGGIRKAIDFAKRFKLKWILSGGEQAWRVADLLAKERVPVMLTNPAVSLVDASSPIQDYDPYDALYAGAAVLNRAGVMVTFMSQDASLSKNVRLSAGIAAGFGLPRDAALRALTLDAATIIGLGPELGSLEPGKRADVVLTDGDILEPASSIRAVWIDGKSTSLETRHTRFYSQALDRLKETAK